MRYYVYLLVSIKKEKVTSYVGYTSSIKKRLEQHNNSKGAKFTRGKLWFLAYKKMYNNRSLAMRNEYLLKKNRKLRHKIKINYLKKFK